MRPRWQSRSLRYILPSMARSPDRSPTKGLFLGLIITIAAVITYSWYITLQISHLRELQNNLVEHNRRDSLQLLRVQNDLNSLGLAMRDMLDNDEPYPITAWSAQFQRIHSDLDSALQTEQQLSAAHRTPEQTRYLQESLAQFWDAADRTFALAQAGKDKDAREQIRLSLQARQATLSTAVSRLLVQNNESEQEAAAQVGPDLRSRAAPGLSFSHRNSRRDPSHQPLYNSLEPSALRATCRALPAAQGTRAEIDFLAGIHAAFHLARAPR